MELKENVEIVSLRMRLFRHRRQWGTAMSEY